MGVFPQGPRKRRREPLNVDAKLVEIYEDLANENNEIRLKAAQELVSKFTPDKNPSDEDIEKALKRLFRGLCSGRKAARVGFSIALTEILSQIFSSAREQPSSEIDVSKAIDLWVSQSTLEGKGVGQEERDYSFGRLFGAEAIVKSSVVFQESVPFEQWTRILSLLFELAQKKPWLREECGWILFCAIQDIAVQKADVKYAETALRLCCENGLVKTPEGVAIWLRAKDFFPNMVFPEGIWKHGGPLHIRERATLCKVMKQSSESESEQGKENGQVQNSGIWNAKLHFAWGSLLQRLYDQPAEELKSKDKTTKSKEASFVEFWTEVVDNGLFAAASSDERKFWGFLLFCKVLEEAPIQFASLVFTKNFLRRLMNQLAVEDRYLHKIALKALRSIQTRVSKEPEFMLPALKGLLGPTGAANFDQITKTKTVEKIIATATPSTLDPVIRFLEEMIANPGAEDEKAAATSRKYLAGLLLSLVKVQMSAKSAAAEGVETSLQRIMEILARFAYFVPDPDTKQSAPAPVPPVDEATQEFFRNKVTSCLNTIISDRKNSSTILCALARKVHKMVESGDWGKLVIEMTGPIQESIDSAAKTLKKLSHKEKKIEKPGKSTIPAFILLFSMTILQVYNGDADAVSMLDELAFCYSKFLGKKADSAEASEGSDALVEILLSFASKQSQLFRRISEQVFGAFADQVTGTGLQSMIAILEADNSLAGQQELFDNQDDDEENIEMADADDDEDDDVEEIEAGSDAGPASDSDEEDDDDDSEEEEEDNDDELAEFDAKLAAALGTHRADKDLEASDSDDADSDMNDEEMEALDAQLVKVFQARNNATSKRKDKKNAKETMINFKNRVLDLLEIYVKKSHSDIIALDLVIPLLRLIRKSTVAQIATRASNVLRDYARLCKGGAGANNSLPGIGSQEQAELVWGLLREVHEEATHSGPTFYSSSCSMASLLLVRILVNHNKHAVGGIVYVYAETQKKMLMSNKCHVRPSFFADWNNWCGSAAKGLKE
ncbi:hypothetical protein AJ80_04096 [Polytolypa hystricis UAMH7299]|uniref:DNA polymerase V n=1 Tax=Polytolypa hystricis (strain UAMH7299) TaxID=1447883 RepID=A0A2B7YDU8_POLH7|nr:hypothetical protein AJ80_04096 [Polytolypa hystricis UAMH7299]